MHSWPMMVESMSATSSRFQRGSSGWTTTSTLLERRRAPSARPWRRRRSEVGGVALVDPAAGSAPADRPRAAGRARGRPACHRAVPLLSASQWPSASQTSTRSHRRADRQRQVGTGLGARRAIGRRDRQRRQRAGLSRPADPQRAPSADEHARAEHRLVRRARRRPALLGGGLGGDGAARDRGRSRSRASCRSWSAGPAFICGPCSTGSRRCRAIDPEVRARGPRSARRGESCRGSRELDPEAAARLKPADTARIARALEVVLSTGRTLAEWQQQREGGIGGDRSTSGR